jgi:autotransporter passenger strand-loop-strand repeat protein
MSIPNSAMADGDTVSYYANDFLLYELTSIVNPISNYPGGHPGRDNNPGDFLYTPTVGETFSGVIGSDDSVFDAAVFQTRADGVSALQTLVGNYLALEKNDPSYTVGSFVSSYVVNATDNVEGAGFVLSGGFASQLSTDAEISSFEAAIIQGEGGNTPVDVQLFFQTGENSGGYISLNTASDVNIIGASIESGTEIDFGDAFNKSIVNGQIIEWSASNATNTISSDVSQSYSSSIDPNLTPKEATVQGPRFSFGSIDTDTFYNIGDGSTIIAGSAGYTLSVTSDGQLIYGLTESFPDFDMSAMGEVPAEVALPPGVYATPADGTLTGAMGASDLVIVNGDNQTYTGQYQGQVIIAAGGNDTLQAGANNETLIDLYSGSDTNILQANGYSGVTLISTPGITSDSSSQPGKQGSVFDFGAPQQYASNSDDIYPNVLIGGSGNNTFVMAPSLTSGTNIIYGGGGTSTYEVYGEVSIVYTHDTNPTPQEIENLSLASGTGNEPLTYIVDPGPNDIIETLDGNYYSGEYEPTIEPAHLVDTPAYVQISETPVTNDVAYNPLGSTATQVGNLEIWNVGPENGNVGIEAWADDNYPYNKITLSNFVNGDLGINFSGNLILDSVANGGADGSADDRLYELAIPGDPGNVFNYTSKTYVGSASSGGDGNNTSSGGSFSSGGTNNGTLSTYPVISSGVTQNISAGNSFVGATIANGGTLIVNANGSDLATVVKPGGVEAIRSGGSAAADGVYGGTEYVSAGGTVSYNAVYEGYNGSAQVPGQEIILSGGVVSGDIIGYGGVQLVSSGGMDDGSIITEGTEYVEDGGFTSGLTIVGDGTAYVEAGGIASGTMIMNGGTQIIASGGIETADVVSGGAEYVSSGGFVGSANVDAGSLVVSAGGQADILAVTAGLASIASGQSEVLVQNDDVATVAAAGNALTTVTFNQSVSGGSLDFINNSTAAQTVFYGDQGSVTAFGGAGGGFYVGGSAGNNVLTGGSGAVTLIGGGNGDVLAANSNTGLNALYAGNGTETLTASAASGENQFDLGPNSNGVISTAGAGLQGFFLNSTGGTTTITGSQTQGAFNLYEFLGDATAGGGAYTLTDFSPANSAIFLLNGTASGPSDATVSTITGATGGTFIGLSDGTQITLLGVAAASVQVITASNGVSVIV